MIEIILIPHDGIEIQNAGKISFGQTPDMVEKILGAPDSRHLSYIGNGVTKGLTLFYDPVHGRVPSGVTFTNNENHYYFDSQLLIGFDADKKVEFIASNGLFSNKIRTMIYDTDFFSLPADEAIEFLEKRNNGRIAYESPDGSISKKSLYFLELGVSLWREMDEADAEESIREAINSGIYESAKESYDNEARKARYFESIGIGKKGYYPFVLV